MNNKSNTVKIVIIVALAVLFVATVLILIGVLDKSIVLFSDEGQDGRVLEYEGEEYVLKDGIETFLVMGLDKLSQDISNDSYNNNQQADFLMLMVFDNKAKTYSTIHINRDTMVYVEKLGVAGEKVDDVYTQIALAHTYGKGGSVSNSNTARAVSKLLCGVKVNHYMSFTLDSIGVMNDLVDGISLEILDDFSTVEGGERLVKGQTVELTAEEARLYVQHRKELADSSNNTRMERQRQYLEAMRTEMEERIENDNDFLANAIVKMADYMDSDCSSARLQEIGKKMQEYEFIKTNEIEGETPTEPGKSGNMEFYPDEKALKKLVIDLFYVPKS